MIKIQEIISIIIISVILAFSITLSEALQNFGYILFSVFLIVCINSLAKKIAAYYADSEVEIKIWQMERWGILGVIFAKGIHPSKNFARPFMLGAFLPVMSKLIFFPIKNFVWMASLIFDVKTKIYKSAKRHNPMFSFSEITDYQIGLIASAGILANLIFAVIGYLIGMPPEMEFVKISIFYTFFNMLPISSLDGNKIFFGNKIMWYTLATLALIGMGFAFLVI